MSKSTRLTPEQLTIMGLEEYEPGLYRQKKNKSHPLTAFKAESNDQNPPTLREDIKFKVHVGIDPGKSGGIVYFDPAGRMHSWVMPLLGDDIDGNQLYSIIEDIKKQFDPVIIIEDVHSIFGASAKSNWQFGFVCGLIRAMVIAHKIPFHMVQPKEWQKLIWTNDDKVYKPKKPEQKRPSLDTKATSLKAALRLFPSADFRKSNRSTIPHDGIVDACLLSTYGRRINL